MRIKTGRLYTACLFIFKLYIIYAIASALAKTTQKAFLFFDRFFQVAADAFDADDVKAADLSFDFLFKRDQVVYFFIRDHDRERFEDRKRFIESCVEKMNEKYGEGTVTAVVKDQYYNMKEKIDAQMHVIDLVLRAMQECGVAPKVKPIRGGTDGAQLSFKGLPCPNIFAGGINFHGPYEFVPIQSMEKAMQVIVKICEITADYND